jgi:hypothetical protein
MIRIPGGPALFSAQHPVGKMGEYSPQDYSANACIFNDKKTDLHHQRLYWPPSLHRLQCIGTKLPQPGLNEPDQLKLMKIRKKEESFIPSVHRDSKKESPLQPLG